MERGPVRDPDRIFDHHVSARGQAGDDFDATVLGKARLDLADMPDTSLDHRDLDGAVRRHTERGLRDQNRLRVGLNRDAHLNGGAESHALWSRIRPQSNVSRARHWVDGTGDAGHGHGESIRIADASNHGALSHTQSLKGRRSRGSHDLPPIGRRDFHDWSRRGAVHEVADPPIDAHDHAREGGRHFRPRSTASRGGEVRGVFRLGRLGRDRGGIRRLRLLTRSDTLRHQIPAALRDRALEGHLRLRPTNRGFGELQLIVEGACLHPSHHRAFAHHLAHARGEEHDAPGNEGSEGRVAIVGRGHPALKLHPLRDGAFLGDRGLHRCGLGLLQGVVALCAGDREDHRQHQQPGRDRRAKAPPS